MAVTLANSLEGGTNGSLISVANSGGSSGDAFTAVSAGASAVTYSNLHARGTLSMAINTGGSIRYARWTVTGGAVTTLYFRAYVYFTGYGSSGGQLFELTDSSQGRCAEIKVQSNGKISMISNGGSSVDGIKVCNLNGWTRIEGFVTGSASAGQMQLKVFLTPDSATPDETVTSNTSQNTRGLINYTYFGQVNANSPDTTYWLDDIGISDQGYLGPSGPPPAVNAPAGVSAGTGTAKAPVLALGIAPRLAAGTGLSQSPVLALGIAPRLAAGTGLSQSSAIAIAVTAGLATGAGTASSRTTPDVTVMGGAATGAGTAGDAVVLTGVSTQAGLATAIGRAWFVSRFAAGSSTACVGKTASSTASVKKTASSSATVTESSSSSAKVR